MILVLVKFAFFIVVGEDAVSIEIPRWARLVIAFVDFTQVKSKIVGDFPVILSVVPSKVSKLILQIFLHVFLSILVIVQVSTLTFVIAFMRELCFFALLDLEHLWAQVRILTFRLFNFDLLIGLWGLGLWGLGLFRLLVDSLLFLNFFKTVFNRINKGSITGRLILRPVRLL